MAVLGECVSFPRVLLLSVKCALDLLLMSVSFLLIRLFIACVSENFFLNRCFFLLEGLFWESRALNSLLSKLLLFSLGVVSVSI